MGKFTKNTTQASLAFDDLYGELLDLFTRAGITPGVSGSVTPQLHSVLMRLLYADPNAAGRLISANKNIDATQPWVDRLFIDTAGVTITFPDVSAITPAYKQADILNLSGGDVTIILTGSGLGNVILPPGGEVSVYCVRPSSGVYTWRHDWNKSAAANNNTIALRGPTGTLKAAAPVDAADVIRKSELTTHAALTASASVKAHSQASAATPLMDGVANVGSDNGNYAREGHVHPTDTSRAAASHTQAASTITDFATAVKALVQASSEAPLMDGAASAGTDNGKYAREAHVHPIDTSRAAVSHTQAASTITDFSSAVKTLINAQVACDLPSVSSDVRTFSFGALSVGDSAVAVLGFAGSGGTPDAVRFRLPTTGTYTYAWLVVYETTGAGTKAGKSTGAAGGAYVDLGSSLSDGVIKVAVVGIKRTA